MAMAIRLRTTDPKDAQGRYRYLQAVNGGGFGLLATRVATPGQSETFLFQDPSSFPLSSGDQLSMNLVNSTFDPTPDPFMLVRVQHGVRTFPPSNRKDPPLVTYEIGGAGQGVWVTAGFSAGYPGYPGDDPLERIFDILTQATGPINNGDLVSLRINSNLGSTFFFRVTGPADNAPIDGDGTAAFLPATTFVIEFADVRSGIGPCGGVKGRVTRASGGQLIPGATVTALNVLGNRSYGATSDGAGNYTLSNPVDGSCMPVGTIKVQASANRFQTKTIDPVAVTEGPHVTTDIQLDCTLVKIKLVDSANQPIIGIGVWLIDSSGNQILDLNQMPYDSNTGFDGVVTFRCVPHGAVIVETDADSTVHVSISVPPEGVERTIVVQNTCGNIVGRVVTDAVTGTGVPNATVRLVGRSEQTTSDANGNFQFPCVRPAGPVTVRATDSSCGTASAMVTVPASGNSAQVIIPLNCSAVIVDSIVGILQWGTQPVDLDAHLSGPDGQGSRFHVFWMNRGNSPVPFASLDRDDRDGQGPEVLSIIRSGPSFVAGDYHLWVHNYLGPSFTGSNAVFTVLRVNPQGLPTQLSRQEVQFATGNQNDNIWHVVNLAVTSGGTVTVTVVQTVQAGDSNSTP